MYQIPANHDERRQYVQDLLDLRVPFGEQSEFRRRVSVELWSRIQPRKARYPYRRSSRQLVEYTELTVVAYDVMVSPGDVWRGFSAIAVLQPILYVDEVNQLYRVHRQDDVERVVDLAMLSDREISRLAVCVQGDDDAVRALLDEVIDASQSNAD